MKKLVGVELHDKVVELGELSPKEKAALCGYGESVKDFVDAWLEACGIIYELPYENGKFTFSAHELVGTKKHKFATTCSSNLCRLFDVKQKDLSSGLPIEFAYSLRSSTEEPLARFGHIDGVQLLAAMLLASYESEEGSWFVWRHMDGETSENSLAVILSKGSKSKSWEIIVEAQYADGWWDNRLNEIVVLSSEASCLPPASEVRHKVFNSKTGEEIESKELEEFPEFPAAVKSGLMDLMRFRSAFVTSDGGCSYQLTLNPSLVRGSCRQVPSGEDFSVYSDGFDRKKLDLLSYAVPRASVRYWFPH